MSAEKNQLNNIVNRFTKIVNDFRSKGIIKNEDLQNYTESNLHSWLQYALIKSGVEEGLFAIPEVKLRFSVPIDPLQYGLHNKKRKRHFSKVDVAFYDNNKNLVGISEIFTMDEAHGCLPSKKLAEVGHYWLTPRDSLLHLVEYAIQKPKFIILVTILLKKSTRLIPWKTKIKEIDSKLIEHKNYYEVFKPFWEEITKKIKIENTLLIINEEDEIERISNIG